MSDSICANYNVRRVKRLGVFSVGRIAGAATLHTRKRLRAASSSPGLGDRHGFRVAARRKFTSVERPQPAAAAGGHTEDSSLCNLQVISCRKRVRPSRPAKRDALCRQFRRAIRIEESYPLETLCSRVVRRRSCVVHAAATPRDPRTTEQGCGLRLRDSADMRAAEGGAPEKDACT